MLCNKVTLFISKSRCFVKSSFILYHGTRPHHILHTRIHHSFEIIFKITIVSMRPKQVSSSVLQKRLLICVHFKFYYCSRFSFFYVCRGPNVRLYNCRVSQGVQMPLNLMINVSIFFSIV